MSKFFEWHMHQTQMYPDHLLLMWLTSSYKKINDNMQMMRFLTEQHRVSLCVSTQYTPYQEEQLGCKEGDKVHKNQTKRPP